MKASRKSVMVGVASMVLYRSVSGVRWKWMMGGSSFWSVCIA